jgi:hypothetical protein
MIKKIKLKGARNTRLVPSFTTSDGKKAKEGAFIRSGKLNKVKKEKREAFLKEYNVTRVLDFRTDVEIHEAKPFTYPENIEYLHLPSLTSVHAGRTKRRKSVPVPEK